MPNGRVLERPVNMLYGRVLERPVNMLYPLEVTEEEKGTQPTPKRKELVRHQTDKNLQEGETEEEERSRNEHNTARRTYPHTLSAVRVILITASILKSSVPAKSQFHVCAKYGYGLYVKEPCKLNCKEVARRCTAPGKS
uniref:Uncharacterized protein n=1 Tax=Parascaris univalens TaxID=6257 RepID=A0A915A8F9_PARUN